MPEVTPTPKTTARKRQVAKASTHKTVATRLHSKLIRQNATCEYWTVDRDCYGDVQCAHIIRRARAATRSDLENAMALCAKHHQYLDSHIFDLIRFVDLTRGEGTYDRLQAKADAGVAATGMSPLNFWKAERARLTEIAKQRGVL